MFNIQVMPLAEIERFMHDESKTDMTTGVDTGFCKGGFE